MKTISRDELKQKIDRKDNFVLVEALGKTAYDHAHLPGAINIPSDQVSVLAPRLLPDKAADIVVYCASPTGHASENVARELAANGYTKVRDYAEGKSDWINAGLPTESNHQHGFPIGDGPIDIDIRRQLRAPNANQSFDDFFLDTVTIDTLYKQVRAMTDSRRIRKNLQGGRAGHIHSIR